MSTTYNLSDLPSILYEKIKKDQKILISQMPEKVLGIHYGAFLRRVKENRLLFFEVAKIATYCGYTVTVEIEDMEFQNMLIEDPQAKSASKDPSQKELYKIIKLMEENRSLLIENQRLMNENTRLKTALSGLEGGNE